MKLRKLSTKKIKQPLHKKIMQSLRKKIRQSLRKKKSCNLKKNKSCNPSDWVRKITQPLHTQKSRNLSTHKITQPLKKHRKNCKRLPWEHHIGCQMCQIALSKSTKKDFFLQYGQQWQWRESSHNPSTQKNHATFFLGTLGKCKGLLMSRHLTSHNLKQTKEIGF